MSRLFNVKTDEQERYRIQNAIWRLRWLLANNPIEVKNSMGVVGHCDHSAQIQKYIKIYEERLRELESKWQT